MLVDLFLANLDDLSDNEVLHEVSRYAIILDDECTMCGTWRNTISQVVQPSKLTYTKFVLAFPNAR